MYNLQFFLSLKTLFIIVLLSSQSTTYAQKAWTLEQCINYAIENNIQTKQAILNTEITKNNLKQSELAIFPNLNSNIGRNYSFGRNVDPFTNDFSIENNYNDNIGVSSSATVFGGFTKVNTIKRNRLNLKAEIESIEKLKNDISINITTAYLNILFNEELLIIAQNQINITKEQIERTKILVDEGSLTIGDLFKIKSQLANEELNIVNSQNQLDISYLNITQLLNLKQDGNFKIAIPNTVNIIETNLPVLNDILRFSENLPEIKSAMSRLSSAEQNLLISKGMRYPRVNLSIGYGSGYSSSINELNGATYKDQFKENANASLGIQLTIPIFSNWQTNTDIKNAKISVLNSELALELEKQTLEKQIQQRYFETKASLKKYEATKIALKSIQESFKYTQEKYNYGLVSTVDYSVSKNELIKIQSELLQAKYEYIFKIKILNFYTGKNISLE